MPRRHSLQRDGRPYLCVVLFLHEGVDELWFYRYVLTAELHTVVTMSQPAPRIWFVAHYYGRSPRGAPAGIATKAQPGYLPLDAVITHRSTSHATSP
jgi:hypothetical protein